MLPREPADEFLPYGATSRPQVVGVLGRHDRPYRDAGRRGVGDGEVPAPPVPGAARREELLEVRPYERDRCRVVAVDEHRPRHLRAAARPVLERPRGEVRDGERDATLVPGPDREEGEGHLLHDAPFAVHDDGVTDADHVTERDLEAGEEVAQRRLGRHTGHDADDAGRGEQGRAEGTEGGEGHEGRGGGEHPDGDGHHPHDQRDLGTDPAEPGGVAGTPGVPRVRGLDDGRDRPYRQPRTAADQAQQQDTAHRLRVLVERPPTGCRHRVRPFEQGGHDDDVQRRAAAAQQPPQRGLRMPRVGEPCHQIRRAADDEGRQRRAADGDRQANYALHVLPSR